MQSIRFDDVLYKLPTCRSTRKLAPPRSGFVLNFAASIDEPSIHSEWKKRLDYMYHGVCNQARASMPSIIAFRENKLTPLPPSHRPLPSLRCTPHPHSHLFAWVAFCLPGKHAAPSKTPPPTPAKAPLWANGTRSLTRTFSSASRNRNPPSESLDSDDLEASTRLGTAFKPNHTAHGVFPRP